MRKTLTLFLLSTIFGYGQSLRWAADFGDSGGSSICTGMVADAAGNIYAVGLFKGSVDFDPGPNVFYINELSASVGDMYLVKLNRNGQLVWARAVGGAAGYSTTEETTPVVALDASGNIYVSGLYMNNVDMDPGTGTYFLPVPSDSSTGNFMSKISPSGNLVWCKQIGGSFGWHFTRRLKLDGAGNIYLAGYFRNYTTFTINGTPLTFTTGYDKFNGVVVKFDNGGNGLWAFTTGNDDVSDFIRDMDVDAAGNIALTGSFHGTVDFDPGAGNATLVSNGTGDDAFVAKYGTDMSLQWVRPLAETGSNFSESGHAIRFDADGNIVTSGLFRNTTDFDPDPDAVYDMTSVGQSSEYFWKLTGDGNFVWAETIGAVSVDGAYSYSEKAFALDTDAAGNIYATGNFLVHMDADPGPGEHFLEANGGSYQVFNLSLDGGGNFRWANAYGPDTNKNANGRAIVCNPQGDVVIGGNFQGPMDVNPGGSATVLAGHAPSYDSFVTSYNQPALGTEAFTASRLSVWPNPVTDILHVESDGIAVHVVLCDLSGKRLSVSDGNQVDMRQLPHGIYLLEIDTDAGKTVKKIVK